MYLRYASSLGDVARLSMASTRLTHLDPVVAGQSMSFAVLVAACIQVLAWHPVRPGHIASRAGGRNGPGRHRTFLPATRTLRGPQLEPSPLPPPALPSGPNACRASPSTLTWA